MISNEKTFKSLYKYKNINANYIYDLFNITRFIINNLISKYNEYKNMNEKLLNFSKNIIEYINNYHKINANFANLELYLFGKTILETINNLNQKIINSTGDSSNTLEISQINSILELIYSTIVPRYIKSVYGIIQSLDNKNASFEYILDNNFYSFNIVLDIIAGIVDNKFLEILYYQ